MTFIVDIIEAILKLGLPLAAIGWLLFRWLYQAGELDRKEEHKAIRGRVKKMKKAFRGYENRKARFIFGKWTWFGGGFYGLAGLWTFGVIESIDIYNFFANGNLATLFNETLVAFLVDFLISQLGNSIQALLWFSYWPSETQSVVVWIAVAYLGYWVGIELARRETELPYRLKFKQNPASEQAPPNTATQQTENE